MLNCWLPQELFLLGCAIIVDQVTTATVTVGQIFLWVGSKEIPLSGFDLDILQL